jgi:hypothetical protein
MKCAIQKRPAAKLQETADRKTSEHSACRRPIKRTILGKDSLKKRPAAARYDAKGRAPTGCSVRKRPSQLVAGFKGERVHAVQIGLGTHGTFPENIVGTWCERDPLIAWLSRSLSDARWNHFRCIVVEPVPEHINRVRGYQECLQHLRCLQAAVSDENVEGVELHLMSQKAHDDLLNSVTEDLRPRLAKDLRYVRNMSTVGEWHPFIGNIRKRMWKRYGVDVFSYLETTSTEVWSFSKLAKHYDFCGCEVLLLDTEGHDSKILRSMIQHCQEQELLGKWAWPDVIAFETAGICDDFDGSGTEAETIKMLENCGYLLFLKHDCNADMIHKKSACGRTASTSVAG